MSAPTGETLASKMVNAGGQLCGWGAASTPSLEVIVAVPFARVLKAATIAAASGEPANSPETDAAYFEIKDGLGQMQIFMGSYWVDVASPDFTTVSQAENTSALVIHNLRRAGG